MTDCKTIGQSITELRKQGKLDEALSLGYASMGDCGTSWSVRGALAWVVRDAKVKNFNSETGDPQDLVAAVSEIRTLSDFGLYGDISVYVMASFDAANHLVEAEQFDSALSTLEGLDRNQLSKQPNKFEGKEYPSQIQRWYSGMAKVLEKLEKWEATVALCDEALKSGLFPSDSDAVWFHYRMAIAKLESDPAAALVEIDIVAKIKKEWWIIGQRGRCLRALGREEEALEAFKTALGGIKSSSIAFGIKLLEEMFELVPDSDLKILIVQTLRKIRIDSGWPVKEKYEEMAEEIGAGSPSNFSVEDALTKLADRTTFQNIRNAKPRGQQERVVLINGVTGTVMRLIGAPPAAGFVKVDEHGDVFMSKKENPELAWPPAIGAKITGNLIKGYDKKKDCESVNIADSHLVE